MVQMKPRLLVISTGEISLPSCSFIGELHFFKIDQSGDHFCVSLSIEKGEELDSLAMLVETKITVAQNEFYLDNDLWSQSEQVWSTGIPKCRGRVKVEARMIDLLPTADITQPSKLRKLQILTLNDWQILVVIFLSNGKKRKDEGHNRVVVTMDNEDLKILLNAVVAHDFIIVHRRNYLRLCEIGEQYRILPLLRAVEQYLMDSRIHPMRKLELSVELRMAMLYDRGLREMGAPHIALRKLHQYLAANGETMNDIHPKLLAALNVTPDYICIS